MKMNSWVSLVIFCAVVLLTVGVSAQAATVMKSCQLLDVGVFSDRVHFHCKPATLPQLSEQLQQLSGGQQAGGASLLYFAVEAGNPLASRILELGASAVANGRTVDVYFDDNAGANPPGCLQRDCRRLTGLAMR